MLERVESQIERADCLRQAQNNFAFAISKLEAADEDLRTTSEWKFWHRTALEGFVEVEKAAGKKRSSPH